MGMEWIVVDGGRLAGVGGWYGESEDRYNRANVNGWDGKRGGVGFGGIGGEGFLAKSNEVVGGFGISGEIHDGVRWLKGLGFLGKFISG